MKKSIFVLALIGVAVVLFGAGCTVEADDTKYQMERIARFGSDGFGVYRFVDEDYNVVCYHDSGNGISCVKLSDLK